MSDNLFLKKISTFSNRLPVSAFATYIFIWIGLFILMYMLFFKSIGFDRRSNSFRQYMRIFILIYILHPGVEGLFATFNMRFQFLQNTWFIETVLFVFSLTEFWIVITTISEERFYVFLLQRYCICFCIFCVTVGLFSVLGLGINPGGIVFYLLMMVFKIYISLVSPFFMGQFNQINNDI